MLKRAVPRRDVAQGHGPPLAIDPAAFSTYWTYGSIMDPYGTGYEGEDNIGRVVCVYDNPTGPSVTAWDFMAAHPEVDWDSIRAAAERP